MDELIVDKEGKTFWNTNFSEKKEVDWDEFSGTFFPYITLPIPSTRGRELSSTKGAALQAIIKELEGKTQDENVVEVNIKSFNMLLQWFGPLHEDSSSVADKVVELVTKPWFHGKLSGSAAESRVSSKPYGTYLIRFSASDPGSYALTVQGTRGPKHFRILHKPANLTKYTSKGTSFQFGKSHYGSLDEIVFRYKNELHLREPCPGSQFANVFKPSSSLSARYDTWE